MTLTCSEVHASVMKKVPGERKPIVRLRGYRNVLEKRIGHRAFKARWARYTEELRQVNIAIAVELGEIDDPGRRAEPENLAGDLAAELADRALEKLMAPAPVPPAETENPDDLLETPGDSGGEG